MNLQGKKINFLGDSITQGVGASSPDKIYHAVLARTFGLAEARNYGISGTRFAIQSGTQTRPKDNYVDVNSFCERFGQMDDDADAVVVFGGTNDYGHGDAPIGVSTDRTPYTFWGACHYLFSGLIKKYPTKPIIVMTPLHRINESCALGDSNKEVVGGPLRKYVEIIREVAEYYSLPVVDLYANSGIQPEIDEIRRLYMPDGLHPSDEGNEIIARRLAALLSLL